MRDPIALGALTGPGFHPADEHVLAEFKNSFRVREITFKAYPSNKKPVWIGYADMDVSSGAEVLDILAPGEVFVVVKPSVDRLIQLADYGTILEDPSEKVLVTARID